MNLTKATDSGLWISLKTLLSVVLLASPAWAAQVDLSSPAGEHSVLPEFNFPYQDGLYATVTGILKVKDVVVPNQHTMKLSVKTFKDKVSVRVVMQDHAAPLVVLLLGISGRANEDFSRLWQSWYAEAGFHVLAMDSTFRTNFINVSGHGVSGNLWAETECISQIIDAFVSLKDVREKVSAIGVVGMSYGGVQAMILGRMAAQGKLPFEVSGIQAYSPPLKLENTGALLDRWHLEDRWKYTLVELNAKVGWHKPQPNDTPVPLSAGIMRAAISASFRLELIDVIVRNDEVFGMNLLPRGNSFDDLDVRKTHAATWGFTQFANDMAQRYWKDKAINPGIEGAVLQVHLLDLMSNQSAHTEAIVAANDPLNLPEDLAEISAHDGRGHLTILPRGGHLGYLSDPWTRAKLMTLFDHDLTTPEQPKEVEPESAVFIQP